MLFGLILCRCVSGVIKIWFVVVIVFIFSGEYSFLDDIKVFGCLVIKNVC